MFYFGIIIIVLNLIFGVIIDTFADLRNEKQKKDDIIRNTCFICGLERRQFDNRSISFETHIQVKIGHRQKHRSTAKVGCVFPMVISPEYRPDDHREGALHFTRILVK